MLDRELMLAWMALCGLLGFAFVGVQQFLTEAARVIERANEKRPATGRRTGRE
jgi:hypothetical protein